MWVMVASLVTRIFVPSFASAQTLLESRKLEPIRFQLRWHHQFQFAGYYAAKEKGFYRRAGFDVELIPGSADKQPVREVLSGRAQYAEGNSEVLHSRLKGAPLVALATIFQYSPSILLTLKKSEIKQPLDLIGRRVMGVKDQSDADFLAMFAREKIPLGSIDLLNSSYDVEDLINGNTDAFNAYLTNEPFLLEERNVPYNIINPRDYGVDFYSDILFTSEDEIRFHPGRAGRFRQATLEGWTYALANPEELIQIIRDKYSSEKSVSHMRYEALSVQSLILPELVEIGYTNPLRFRAMAEVFLQQGLVASLEDFDGFIFIHNEKNVSYGFYFLLAVCAFLAAVFVVFALTVSSNLRVKRDVEETLAVAEKLKLLIDENSSTELLNRQVFEKKYHEELTRAQRYGDVFSVLLIDIDHLNKVNGAHGRKAEERVITTMAKVLLGNGRESDYLGRYSHGEFVLLLPRTRVTEATNYAKRLCRYVRENPIRIDESQDVSMTISIGVVEWKPEDKDDETVGNADKALFRARANGRDQVVFWDV